MGGWVVGWVGSGGGGDGCNGAGNWVGAQCVCVHTSVARDWNISSFSLQACSIPEKSIKLTALCSWHPMR